MRRVIHLLALALLTALAAAPAAQATIDNTPIRARMERPERLPEAGSAFTAVIRIEAAARAELRDLDLSGQGWTITRFTAPRGLAMSAKDQLRYEITATPGSGFGPLVLSAEVDGHRWRQSFDLSRKAYGGLLPSDSDRLPSQRILASGGDRLPAHREYSLAELEVMAAAPTDPSAVQARDKDETWCTLTGNVVYWHQEDNLWAFPANPGIYAHGYVDGLPYYYGFVLADEMGRFSISVPSGVPIRLKYKASSAAAVVQQDNVWETDYQWWTPLFTIPEGAPTHDLGPIHPNQHHGALHICTVVTHSRNHLRDVGQDAGYHWNVDKIDVQWPEENGRSFYNDGFEEIHLGGDVTWRDWVISHEWGHYWNDMHAHFPDHDYCNGICDDGDDCGHCLWCPEESAVAWKEGLANIISRLATAYMVPLVAHDVRHIPLEEPHNDPECPWDPWYIENVVAGAIWDVANDSRGIESYGLNTDVLGNPLHDQLALGPAEVLRAMTVHCDVEGHRPYRMPDYFRCLAERLAELGDPDATLPMLWETAMNWDLQMDEEPPSAVTNLTSTLPVNTPTPQAIGGFYWDEPTDDLSGTAGYSVALVQGSGPAMPDHVVDTVNQQIWTNEFDGHLTPGTYYFSVIAVDRAGNWGTVPASYGPIIVTEPYPVDLRPYPPTGWTSPLVLRSTEVPDSGPVTQSITVHGHTIYLNLGYRNTAGGASGSFRNAFYIDGDEVLVSNTVSLGGGALGEQRNLGPLNLDVTGRRTVWARIDGQDDVPELDEDNNVSAKQFVFRPASLSLDQTIARTGGLPHPEAGHELLSEHVNRYPNGDGFDMPTTLFPEVVWAAPDDRTDHLIMRLYAHDVGQTGFAEALVESPAAYSQQPAAVFHNPWLSEMYSYCVGVSDGSTEKDGGNTYRIHREVGRAFSMPDTLEGLLYVADSLDLYLTQNGTGEPAWFTIKLANGGARVMWMHIIDPDLAMGTLADASVMLEVAAGDTIHHSLLLPPSQTALTVVTREPNLSGTSPYTISAYPTKPDLAATTPAGWFANLVPHVGRPHSYGGDVPEPTRLSGATDSTTVYWSLRNISESAGVPIGLQRRIELDGALLSSVVFAEPIAPGQEVRSVHPFNQGGHYVQGGRHTLTHRINSTLTIDEDNLANNRHGRQWVWEPTLLTANENHTLPMPSSAYAGLDHITEGLVAPNCDGYRVRTTVPFGRVAVIATYTIAEGGDVDVGYYTSADVQNGFSAAHTQSTWSGDGCDFVLRSASGPVVELQVGLTRATGGAGDVVTLRAQRSTSVWEDPLSAARTGVIGADTFLSSAQLALPPGDYRFVMQSDDAPLGFSLHDLSDGYSAKTSPWQDGIAWQLPESVGEDVEFIISVPDPAPALFGLAVWRPDATGQEISASWSVSIDLHYTGVDDGGPDLPSPLGSRLLSVAPNPFNPATTIEYEIARAGSCVLTVHDVRGRVVRTLVAGEAAPGRYAVRWDGHDDSGRRVSSGPYMARLRAAGGEGNLLKLMLVK